MANEIKKGHPNQQVEHHFALDRAAQGKPSVNICIARVLPGDVVPQAEVDSIMVHIVRVESGQYDKPSRARGFGVAS